MADNGGSDSELDDGDADAGLAFSLPDYTPPQNVTVKQPNNTDDRNKETPTQQQQRPAAPPPVAITVTPPPLADENERLRSEVSRLRTACTALQSENERQRKALTAVASTAQNNNNNDGNVMRGDPRRGAQSGPGGGCAACRQQVLVAHSYTVLACPQRHVMHTKCAVDMALNMGARCPVCPGTTLDFGQSEPLCVMLARHADHVERMRADVAKQHQQQHQQQHDRYTGVPSEAGGATANAPTGMIASVLRLTRWPLTKNITEARKEVERRENCDRAYAASLVRFDGGGSGQAFEMLRRRETPANMHRLGVTVVDIVNDPRVTVATLTTLGYTPRDWVQMELSKDDLFRMHLCQESLAFENIIEQLIDCYRFNVHDFFSVCGNDWTLLGELRVAPPVLQRMGVNVGSMVALRATREHIVEYFGFDFGEWHQYFGLTTLSTAKQLVGLGLTLNDCDRMCWQRTLFRERIGVAVEQIFPHQQQQQQQPSSAPAVANDTVTAPPLAHRAASPVSAHVTVSDPSPVVVAARPQQQPDAASPAAALRGRHRRHFMMNR